LTAIAESGHVGRAMTSHAAEISDDLPCHRCGYDLRAHPRDGKCPECEASVAESVRFAAIPLRPAWRDSDPRWRRRILAGAWILVCLPLMDALRAFDWASSVPAPTVVGARDPLRTLDDTFVFWPGVYQPLIFCIGVVLLFSKERGRRRNPLDWTRRWGVLCSYVTLLLSAAPVLYFGSLVLVGISALFLSMPPKYQPGVTDWFARASVSYLRYGPKPKDVAYLVLIAVSSVTLLLACAPLFTALRSTGSKRLPAILLPPLALFALIQFAQAARYALGFSTMTSADFLNYGVYFRPELALTPLVDPSGLTKMGAPELVAFFVEIIKWCIVLAVAIWLTFARFATWRQGTTKKTAGQGLR
jgi:hypothetical protein